MAMIHGIAIAEKQLEALWKIKKDFESVISTIDDAIERAFDGLNLHNTYSVPDGRYFNPLYDHSESYQLVLGFAAEQRRFKELYK